MTTIYNWSDVDPELARDTSGDITKDTDVDAVMNSIRNIIGTDQGTRRMLQRFGADIRSLLFEPMDQLTARLIGQRVVDSIRYWDDRVIIEGLDIEPLYDQGVYRCRLNFTIVGSDIVEEIDFVLSR